MATGSFTHTIAQIDYAVDSIGAVAQRIGVSAIVPCTAAEYDAIEIKSATTLYLVYRANDFLLYYGTLPLYAAGGGGGSSLPAGRAVGLATGTADCIAGQAQTID